jgi:hypothetical protein
MPGEDREPDVVCTSTRAFDGNTLEPIGWIFGFHFVTRMPEDEVCPICGCGLALDEVR